MPKYTASENKKYREQLERHNQELKSTRWNQNLENYAETFIPGYKIIKDYKVYEKMKEKIHEGTHIMNNPIVKEVASTILQEGLKGVKGSNPVVDAAVKTIVGTATNYMMNNGKKKKYFIKNKKDPPNNPDRLGDEIKQKFSTFGDKINPPKKQKKEDPPTEEEPTNEPTEDDNTIKAKPNLNNTKPLQIALALKGFMQSKRTLVKGIQKHLLPFTEREWASELKAYGSGLTQSFPSTINGSFALLNLINKGYDYDARVGSILSMQFLFLQVYYQINNLVNEYELHRFMIVYDMQPNSSTGGLPNTQELLFNPEVMSMTNLTYRDRWLILYDNWFSLSKTSNPNLIVQINLSLHSLKAIYPAGADDWPSFGRLYAFAISDTAAVTNITVTWRIRFYNN